MKSFGLREREREREIAPTVYRWLAYVAQPCIGVEQKEDKRRVNGAQVEEISPWDDERPTKNRGMCHTVGTLQRGQKEDRHAWEPEKEPARQWWGGRHGATGKGYHDGKEQAEMSERFLAISQVFPVRERPCPTPCQLIYGLQDTCKHESRCRRGCSGPFLNVLTRLPSHSTSFRCSRDFASLDLSFRGSLRFFPVFDFYPSFHPSFCLLFYFHVVFFFFKFQFCAAVNNGSWQ